MGNQLQHPVRSAILERELSNDWFCGAAEVQGYRKDMEDATLIQPSLPVKQRQLSCFGIFDGHGGSAASRFLQRQLPAYVVARPNPTDPAQISAAIEEADAAFLRSSQQPYHGSTLVTAWVDTAPEKSSEDDYHVTIAHVGDARAWVLRADGKTWQCLTADHRPDLPAEKTRILAAGGTVRSARVDGNLAISRAFGDSRYKHNTALPANAQKVIATPDVKQLWVKEGDYLLLACDGITEQASNAQICGFVFDQLQQPAVAGDLARIALNLIDASIEWGSADNHSVLLVRFGKAPISSSPSPVVHKEFLARESVRGLVSEPAYATAVYEFASRYGLNWVQLHAILEEHLARPTTAKSGESQLTEAKQPDGKEDKQQMSKKDVLSQQDLAALDTEHAWLELAGQSQRRATHRISLLAYQKHEEDGTEKSNARETQQERQLLLSEYIRQARDLSSRITRIRQLWSRLATQRATLKSAVGASSTSALRDVGPRTDKLPGHAPAYLKAFDPGELASFYDVSARRHALRLICGKLKQLVETRSQASTSASTSAMSASITSDAELKELALLALDESIRTKLTCLHPDRLAIDELQHLLQQAEEARAYIEEESQKIEGYQREVQEWLKEDESLVTPEHYKQMIAANQDNLSWIMESKRTIERTLEDLKEKLQQAEGRVAGTESQIKLLSDAGDTSSEEALMAPHTLAAVQQEVEQLRGQIAQWSWQLPLFEEALGAYYDRQAAKDRGPAIALPKKPKAEGKKQ